MLSDFYQCYFIILQNSYVCLAANLLLLNSYKFKYLQTNN